MGWITPNSGQGQLYNQKALQKPSSQMPQTHQASSAAPSVGNTNPQLGDLLLSPLMNQHAGGMNPQEFSHLLKQLLQLPKEIRQLLAMLAFGEPLNAKMTLKKIQQMLLQNPTIALEDLQILLKQQTKVGHEKLQQLLQSGQMGLTGDSKMMGELLTLTTQLAAKASLTPQDALTNIMLLYLPWYPLPQGQKLQMYFEGSGDEEESGESVESVLVMLIETRHLGRFKITTVLTERTQLIFKIEHDPQASPTLQAIEKQLPESLSGIPAPIFALDERSDERSGAQMVSQADPTSAHSDATPSSPAVVAQPSGKVSTLVINAAYLLVRMLFEADERYGLHATRSGMV